MSLIFVRPGHAMGVGGNSLALYAPLMTQTTLPASTEATSPLSQIVSGTEAWWDASSPSGLLGPNKVPVSVWSSSGVALIDLSGNGRNLVPFSTTASLSLPLGSPHLSGLLGGVGYVAEQPGLLQPALDPDLGWQVPTAIPGTTSSWTWYLVWSRPNWRQGSGHDATPITLLTIGSQPILQVDSNTGVNRLVLFPGAGESVVTDTMTRRHTHSVVIRYSPSSGADLWLDDTQVAQSVRCPVGAILGSVNLLHDGTSFGAAQCWLHEAAEWSRVLSDGEVAAVVSYARRWARGARKGLYLIINGQSNAINYSINDGAAALLARGIAWHLGALAYNILDTTGSSTSYTMQSGHGIYAVSTAGYPGSFVMDPGDGSNPSSWSLGADGLAVQQAIIGLPAEDLADMSAIMWPWNETDSLRQYSEYATFEAAALRFLLLLRTMLGDVSNRIPLIWWNAIPYGSPDGATMHRQVVQSISSNAVQNVVIGNRQTSDSNARGSSWDPTSGISTGGDSAHRDSADNLRLAMLASPIVARAILATGFADSIVAIPEVIPKLGGPSIVHVYRKTSVMLILTIVHDSGSDLKVPLLAEFGAGFAVMDGGAPGNAGPIIEASSCQRIDSTHLQLTLANALQQASDICQLFYPYGPSQIGRGNAVTDNFSSMALPEGWDASIDLGSNWKLDCPLSATFSGIALSDASS